MTSIHFNDPAPCFYENDGANSPLASKDIISSFIAPEKCHFWMAGLENRYTVVMPGLLAIPVRIQAARDVAKNVPCAVYRCKSQ